MNPLQHIKMKFFNNIIFIEDNRPHNPLIHAFILQTLSFGIALLFFTDRTSVNQSILYKLTLYSFPDIVLSVWAAWATLVFILITIAFQIRVKWFSRAVSFSGFVLWFYAGFIYLTNLYVLQFFFAALPNMFFWGYMYVYIGMLHSEKEGDREV